MAAKIKITLTGSLIGRLKAQIATAGSLGLRRIGDTTVQDESDALTGKLKVISHLVKTERV